MEPGWRPTHAHLRAAVVGLAVLVVGVAVGRADAVVIAAPLVLVTLWSAQRPTPSRRRRRRSPRSPSTRARRSPGRRRSRACRGAGSPPSSTRADGCWRSSLPRVCSSPRVPTDRPGSAVARIGLRPLRWGRRHARRPGGGGVRRLVLVALGPGPARRDADDRAAGDCAARGDPPAPHPRGLVGMERAARPGEGKEFAKVRPFGLATGCAGSTGPSRPAPGGCT